MNRLKCTMLAREWLGLLLWEAAHLVVHPEASLTVMRRFVRPTALYPKRADSRGRDQGYELRPIAVKADFGRRGIASALVRRLLDDARSRGFLSVHLQTEVDNDPANAFYRKSSFALESATNGYNHYRIRLNLLARPSLPPSPSRHISTGMGTKA